MKSVLFALGAACLLAACNQATENKAETAETTIAPRASGVAYYGDTITEEGAITAEQLVKELEGKDSVRVKLMSDVLASCTKKGCWMDVQTAQGAEPIKVTFKDYGFFVPVDTTNPDVNKGKQAIMEGWAFREEVSVADQQHYLEDAGKSKEEIAAVTAPKTSITFVADGVILK